MSVVATAVAVGGSGDDGDGGGGGGVLSVLFGMQRRRQRLELVKS